MGKDLESELEMPTDDKPEGGKSVKDLLDEHYKPFFKILAEEIERSDKASLSAIKESANKTAYTGYTTIPVADEEIANAKPDWGFPVEPEARRRTDTDLSIGSDSDLEDYIARHREWSYKTFGPGSRAEGLLKHIRKELLEIEADPGDLMEWVDVMILAIDGAWRAGFTPFEVSEALKRKQEVNFRRKWPDWKRVQDGEPIEHEK